MASGRLLAVCMRGTSVWNVKSVMASQLLLQLGIAAKEHEVK